MLRPGPTEKQLEHVGRQAGAERRRGDPRNGVAVPRVSTAIVTTISITPIPWPKTSLERGQLDDEARAVAGVDPTGQGGVDRQGRHANAGQHGRARPKLRDRPQPREWDFRSA